jgi:hypothetical protein
MATPRFVRAFHCRQDRFLLRVDVASCRGKVAVCGSRKS